MIHDERVKLLNRKPVTEGSYVLYWMQASQRAEYNHALEHAVRTANRLGLPVVAFFGITGSYPGANERHYHFMLEGLREVREELAKRGIKLVVRMESPEKGVLELAGRAALIVTDRGYLRIQKSWRSYAAKRSPCAVIQVESDVVVPVEAASSKEEYSAATLRPKIRRLLAGFMKPARHSRPLQSSLDMRLRSIDIGSPGRLPACMEVDRSVGRAEGLTGGTGRAKALLRSFIRNKLERYAEEGNDPVRQACSGLSPYLHFGQISPLYIALQVGKHRGPGAEAFLEQLIVRRELAINFVYYNERYDSYECLPDWARMTLELHCRDRREYVYTFDQLEQARTHDPYWNAAQDEMRLTGYMQGYMRMYWGKKILEWTPDPESAFDIALALNNRYELDGRDPNGFAGVAWCFGKHDRPWQERPVFGKIRYMNANGLRRKFDIERYVERVERIGNGH